MLTMNSQIYCLNSKSPKLLNSKNQNKYET
jgi:hypothetical protein